MTIEAAAPTDVAAVLSLRDDAARWLLSRGIEQWRPGEMSVRMFANRVTQGRLFVARHAGSVVGTVSVLWSDGSWEDRPANAGYIHTLVVARDWSGRALGLKLLAFAETVIATAGYKVLRLDCVSTNQRLRRYYRDAGYVEVGQHEFEDPRWHPVTLFEKPVNHHPQT